MLEWGGGIVGALGSAVVAIAPAMRTSRTAPVGSSARSAQLSLRISADDLSRIRSAAGASGETVARFVRDAVSERCAAVERGRAASGDARLLAGGDRLPRSERRVFAAVCAHAGLGSVAAVAAAAGVSWSTARGALDGLARRGAIRQHAWTQSWRDGVRERHAWAPVMSWAGYERLVAHTSQLSLPAAPLPRVHTGRLPPQFWSLFWNHPDPSSLRLPDDADYVANRLLNGPSPHASLWAAVRLPADALRSCLRLRSTRPVTRDLIHNALAHRSTVPA